jgi:geranylgeranyl diphosphate synthase type I
MGGFSQDDIVAAIGKRAARVRAWLAEDDFLGKTEPPSLREAAGAYLARGGKGLRPATVLMACGTAGGEENLSLAAGAAVEITHNWTLIHDDLIDRDDKRRGAPSVHALMAAGAEAVGFGGEAAGHYGVSLAILGGDVGPSWAAHLMARLPANGVTSPATAFALATELAAVTVPAILAGEAEDLELSRRPLEEVTLAQVEAMLARKTGALYEWCARAGATIGGADYGIITTLSEFALLCGTAFQHVDDVLPYVADEARVGKPAASDLREGKRTAVVLAAFERANEKERSFLAATLGNAGATADELNELKNVIEGLGGVEFARDRARWYYERALALLERLPANDYREMWAAWARYLLTRDL